ncbi:MAG: carboxy terminal-processing peptidase [Terrimicrobiaceae bacterium]|nr:carboxy terminal-processing peptidase [Terrimicrobiaceae bacterium]
MLGKGYIGTRIHKELVKKGFSFTSNRTAPISRQKAPWPASKAEADRLWADIVEGELLKETLNEFKLRTPEETVLRRYDQVLRNVREMEDEDVVKVFLSSLAQTYDPHSDYLSPSDMENFQISMRPSLVGVGAVLRSEDGYARVMEVVPGGPADRDGRLAVGDRIAAVAQGDGEFEDVVDMKLDRVVEKIRGKKGTKVRLLVLPQDAADPSQRRVIEIVRDEVQLKEQEARAELLDVMGGDGKRTRIGWIFLPSFYAEMENRGGKSTTADVRALLERLKKEGMQGLVIDLRRDGGGSLEEAINLTGLFIPGGPVVQSKDSNGRITVSKDTDPSIAWDGPLVVLVNRLSASASEIFAAALQDYGRAVIVGDERTFGKGTVQTVLELGRLMSPFSLSAADAGALKLTIQKFYRVRGGSTQLKGVEPDIILPSLTDNPEIGEGALKNSLPYDEVAPARFQEFDAGRLFLDQLRERSARRIAGDPEFSYILSDAARLRQRIAENRVSLNLAERQAEIEADKQRREARTAERAARGPRLDVAAYEIKLDDLKNPELRAVAYDRKNEKRTLLDLEEEEAGAETEARNEVLPDPIRDETLRIAADLVQLAATPKTARAAQETRDPGSTTP